MTETQATVVVVLLAIPVGVMVLSLVVLSVDCAIDAIKGFFRRRKWKRDEPVRDLDTKCHNLGWDVKRLERDLEELRKTVESKKAAKEKKTR